jgi:hypothetical protein
MRIALDAKGEGASGGTRRVGRLCRAAVFVSRGAGRPVRRIDRAAWAAVGAPDQLSCEHFGHERGCSPDAPVRKKGHLGTANQSGASAAPKPELPETPASVTFTVPTVHIYEVAVVEFR